MAQAQCAHLGLAFDPGDELAGFERLRCVDCGKVFGPTTGTWHAAMRFMLMASEHENTLQ